MSFLQLIAKSPERQTSNPAFLLLSNRTPLPRWGSFKSEPKEHASDSPQKAAQQGTGGPKPRTALMKRALFARGKNPNNGDSGRADGDEQSSPPSPLQKRSSLLSSRVQYHHSFSNYLSKKPSTSRRCNLQGRLMYFDLNEIVNKIASPMKLQPKVEGEAGEFFRSSKKKHNNLAHYQQFLKEVHNERNRYHHCEASLTSRTEENQRSSRKHQGAMDNEVIRKRPNTLWIRKPSGRVRDGQEIEPWTEHQQQHSPIRAKKHHSSFQQRSAIVQDFEELLE